MTIKIISLGGSTLFAENFNFNFSFLKKFKALIDNSKDKFIITIGGGKTARLYVNALRKLTSLNDKDYDDVGIETTHLNALFLSKYFKDSTLVTTNKVSSYMIKKLKSSKKKIIFVYGNKPGHTSDYDTVLSAIEAKSKEIINISNIDYVYDKNPNQYATAKIIKELTWKDYFKIVGLKVKASGNYPFDPIASKLCLKNNIKVYVVSYKNIKTIKNILNNKITKKDIFSLIR